MGNIYQKGSNIQWSERKRYE